MKRFAILALVAASHAATSLRAPTSAQAFDVAPGAPHPVRAADLAWLDGGLASAHLASGPEGGAILSAPNFQVAYGMTRGEEVDPLRPEILIDAMERTRLRLGTGLALSQVGVALEGFDVALGAAFERDAIRFDESDVDGSRQWVDMSGSARLGNWRLGAELAEAVVVSSDSGLGRDRHLALELGRLHEDGFSWGVGMDLPLEDDGETGLRAGMSRDFRGAMLFQGEIATTYAKSPDPAGGGDRLVRRSLDLRLGTRLRFRPWVASDDPEWLRSIVDPRVGGGVDGFILRGWEVGVSAGWDFVTGNAKPSIEVGKAF